MLCELLRSTPVSHQLAAHLPLSRAPQVVFAELAADVYARGGTLAAHWQRLLQRYGAYEYRSGYFIADPPSKSAAVFERLRAAPPAAIGGCAVRAVRDLGTGVDTSQPGGCRWLMHQQRVLLTASSEAAWPGAVWSATRPPAARPPARGAADGQAVLPWQAGDLMITYYLQDAVLTLRASGTEPKLKYCERHLCTPCLARGCRSGRLSFKTAHAAAD